MIRIYSRPGCHLCDEMKVVVERVAAQQTPALAIEIVDVSTDPNLEALYGLEIPVLMVNGRKAAKYHIDETALRRLLEGRAAEGKGQKAEGKGQKAEGRGHRA